MEAGVAAVVEQQQEAQEERILQLPITIPETQQSQEEPLPSPQPQPRFRSRTSSRRTSPLEFAPSERVPRSISRGLDAPVIDTTFTGGTKARSRTRSRSTSAGPVPVPALESGSSTKSRSGQKRKRGGVGLGTTSPILEEGYGDEGMQQSSHIYDTHINFGVILLTAHYRSGTYQNLLPFPPSQLPLHSIIFPHPSDSHPRSWPEIAF